MESPDPSLTTRWDELARELQALRQSDGDPSYADIARRIGERRQENGASSHAAHVARTTVYDAFRTGRARVNLRLIREIAEVLGAEDGAVDIWIARCRTEVAADSSAILEPMSAGRPPARRVLQLMVICVLINMVGRIVVDVLHLPIYLDMVGTAIAAIAVGPWRGAAVGATTNVAGLAVGSGMVSVPFALVNIAGALVWGYGVRRFDFGTTLPRFFGLNLLVAVACTLIAVPILLAYGGSVGQGQDTITETFNIHVSVLALAVGLSNLLTSLADKVISGFLALVAISMLPVSMRAGLRLVLTTSPPGPTPAR